MASASDPASVDGSVDGMTDRLQETVLRHVPDLIIEASRRGIEYISPNVSDILGRDPAALVGQPLEVLLHPDDRPGLEATLRLAAGSTGHTALRRRLMHADGRMLWFEATISPFNAADGSLHAVIIARRVVESVAEARELDTLRTTIDSLPSAILVVGPTGRVFASNEAWRSSQADGDPTPEGKPYAVVAASFSSDPDSVARLSALVTQALAGEATQPTLVQCATDAGPRWWQVSARFATRGRFVTVTHEDVTALVRTERQQAAQQAVLERAQQIGKMGHWEYSREAGITRASAQAMAILGRSAETAPPPGRLLELIPEGDRNLVRDAIQAARAGQSGRTVRHRILRPDGSVRWVDHSFDTRTSGRTGDTVLMGVIQDVTEQVAAVEALRTNREALRESNARRHEALRIARAALWRSDSATGQISWSPEALEIFGDDLGSTAPEVSDRRHPDDAERVARAFADGGRTREGFAVRYRTRLGNGEYRWVEDRVVPEVDKDDVVVGYRGIMQDIQEQVDREAALRESDDRQREALRIARAAVWTWDRRTRTVRQSDDLYSMLAFETMPAAFEDRVAQRHPDDRESSMQFVNDSIRKREPFTVRYRLARPDGTWCWIEERGLPQFDASGELTGYRGTRQDVDEQVRREEALRESDDRRREALRIARAELWSYDARTRRATQSEELFRHYGYERLPDTLDERTALRHPDDREWSRTASTAAMRDRRPYVIRYRMARVDGSYGWIEARGEPQYNPDGEYIGYRGTRQDVDEQVRREEALRESDERQREALDLAHAAIWTWDLRTGHVEQSADFYRRFGYESTPSTYEEHATRRHPDDRERAREASRQAIERRTGYTVRYRLARADGGYVWIEARAVPLFDADGAVIGFRGTSQDVDEQVRREEALRLSEEKARDALRTARASVWTYDALTDEATQSDELFELLGYSEFPASAQERVALRHPDDRRSSLARARAHMIAREPYVLRYRMRRADGEWAWVETRGVPRYDADGQYIGYRGTIQDVDEQIRREEALRESDDRQREALRIARASTWTYNLKTGDSTQSPDLYELLGYQDIPDTPKGRIALTHPDDQTLLQVTASTSMRAREPYTVRYRVRRADGSWAWVEGRGVPQFDADGDLVAYRGTVQDVDEQVRRERDLRESDERAREALHIARADLWTWDRRTREATVSPDLLREFGYDPIPVTRDELLAIRHPDDLDWSRQAADDAIRRRLPFIHRYRIARADGSWAWVETRGVPQFNPEGDLTGYRGTRQDVDEQVRREETLRESDSRQRDALRIARASVWTYDAKTREDTVTMDLYTHLGYEGSLDGDTRIALRHPEDRDRSLNEARAAMRARQPYSCHYRVLRADGSWAWVESRGIPQFTSDGEYTGYRGTIQDVDEQVQREEELRQALKIARAGFWSRGRDDVAPWWSPEIYELIGLDPAAGVSDETWVRHPDDDARVLATMRGAMRRRQPFSVRYRVLHWGTGAWLWIELLGVPVESASGEVIAYRGVVRDISEEVARQADLQRSEALLGQAQRLTSVGSYAANIETGEQHWSDEQFRLLGYEPGSRTATADLFYDRVHPDDLEMVRQSFRDVIRTGEPAVREYRIILPDGRVRHLHGAAELRRDAEGRPAEIVGATQDVTAQVEAEARLRHSEARLRSVLDSVGDGITLHARGGHTVWSNAAFQKMVGYTADELMHMDAASVFDTGTTRDTTTWWRSVIRRRDASLPRSYKVRLRRKDGTILTAESTPSALRDGDEVIGMLSVIRDTTERDRLQAQVDSATQEVAQILQTAPLPIIVIEEDGTVRLANRGTADTFGWTPEELVGQDVSILAAGLNPMSHREYIHAYERTGEASTAQGPMLGRTLEVVARRRDGSEFPAEVSVSEMVDSDGSRRFLGVVTDLTERKRAEEDLTRMQKAEALGTLVAGVAHDFNNLLTAIVGGITMAQEQPRDTRWLGIAQEAAGRATRLVQQLLQFSRRSRPELQDVDAATLVERTTAIIRETIDRRVVVRVEVAPVDGTLAGDEGQLQQVVMNLLVNARDAVLERAEGEDPGYTPHILITVQPDRLRDARAVRIEVRDNGAGMTAAVRARAFDPFFTTKPVGQGTGLGLATVAGIVDRHDGEVTLASTPREGTTVTVRLPLFSPQVGSTTRAEDAVSAPPVTRTAIVIDDEAMVLAVSTAYLESAHYRVIPLPDGNEALRLVEGGEEIDVILSDVNMPSPNGWEILKRLQGRPGVPPIVIVSGYADEQTAREHGAAGFLHKPFTQRALLSVIEEVLGRE